MSKESEIIRISRIMQDNSAFAAIDHANSRIVLDLNKLRREGGERAKRHNEQVTELEAQIAAGSESADVLAKLDKLHLDGLDLDRDAKRYNQFVHDIELHKHEARLDAYERESRYTTSFRVGRHGTGEIARPEPAYVPPPRLAKFVLLLVPHKDRESLLGDLEEEYRTVVLPEQGARKARLYYWWHVACSVRPLLWEKIKYIAGFILLIRSMK